MVCMTLTEIQADVVKKYKQAKKEFHETFSNLQTAANLQING